MAIKTLYTAVGRFERRTNGCNRSCPIILLGGQEYMADMQEMVIWSMLNWRILRWDDIAQEYEKLATASGYCTERSWEDCTNRLLTRGLLVSGSGETEYDALYDLLGSLSIIPTVKIMQQMTTRTSFVNRKKINSSNAAVSRVPATIFLKNALTDKFCSFIEAHRQSTDSPFHKLS